MTIGEYGRRVFESAITSLDGIRVEVAITVPSGISWKDMAETAEIAQMTASRAVAQIESSRDRPPF